MRKAWVLVTAVGALLASCSDGSSAEDRARLEVLRDESIASFTPPDARPVGASDEVGRAFLDIDGRRHENPPRVSRRYATPDPDAAARAAAAELIRSGWGIYKVHCIAPEDVGPGYYSSLEAHKQFDGFVGHAAIDVIYRSDELDIALGAPSAEAEVQGGYFEQVPDVSEQCSRTFGLPVGRPPGCDRWCDPRPLVTTTTTGQSRGTTVTPPGPTKPATSIGPVGTR